MKLKTHLQTSFTLILLAFLTTAFTSPDSNGFRKLNTVYIAAVNILNISNLDNLGTSISQLNEIRLKNENNPKIKEILLLTPETCPEALFADYQKSLALQAEMREAAKRLAMSGVLSGGENGAAFKKFTDAFHLTDHAEKAPLGYEGAPPETKEERDARMQWWRDGKFGMFIHYGLYSGLGGEVLGQQYEGCVEWIQMIAGLDEDTYVRESMPLFNPKSGKAEEWVKLASEAGCKYAVLTTRHHEGFNLFDTQYSDFNSVNLKGIDITKEFAQACRQHDMKIGYYVSLLDWNHPDYDPTGSGVAYPKGNYEAEKAGKRQFGNHEKYKDYLHHVFEELMSNYPSDLIWWDFSQPNFQGDAAWGATRLMRTMFDINPRIVQNNRLYHSDNHLSEGGIKVTPTWKGDYSTAEQHVPATGIDGDWEACQTLNGTWGYSALNQQWKSSVILIHELIDAVSRGGNFLLNIGPEPDGSIPEETLRLFKEIGAWMNINNEAIYETRANPFDVELEWGRVTRKGDNELFLLVYDKPESGIIEIPCLFDGAVNATLLESGQPVEIVQNAENKTTSFQINQLNMHPAATVIKVSGTRI